VIVLINTFDVAAGREDEFLAAWTTVAEVMRKQPGFIRLRMHRSSEGSRFLAVADWDTQGALEAARQSADFRETIAAVWAIARGSPLVCEMVYEAEAATAAP
jgi:heme-degrading monooxygenase HmoA